MNLLKPSRLAKGDTIGIISPSSPHAGMIPERFRRGVKALEDLGYRVKIGKNARNVSGHKAGTKEERVEDLHNMFEDPDVRAIITTIGGYNSNELLDLIDYGLIRRNPKIFC